MTRKSRTTAARPDTPPGYELTASPCLRTLRLTLVFSGGPHFSSCADLLGTYTLLKSSFGGSVERTASFVGRVVG